MSGVSWTMVGLLCISNLIMAYAWYGHLKTMSVAPVWQVILFSWLIALVEYIFMIPANRIGARTMSLDQMKITQEAISLLVFIPFSVFYMKNSFNWNYLAAGACILGAVFFIFRTNH